MSPRTVTLPLAFKPGKRIKCHGLRGTVLHATLQLWGWEYAVALDNGAQVKGSKHQFSPARRVTV